MSTVIARVKKHDKITLIKVSGEFISLSKPQNYHVQGHYKVGASYSYLESAQEAMLVQKDDLALSQLQSSLIHFPFNHDTHLLMSQLKECHGYYEEALYHFRLAKELKRHKPENPGKQQLLLQLITVNACTVIRPNDREPIKVQKKSNRQDVITDRENSTQVGFPVSANKDEKRAPGRQKLKNLVYAIPMVITGLFPIEQAHSQEGYTANPFVQPNDSTLNWYGSGDSNGDDTLTQEDAVRMQEVINGQYTPNLTEDPRAYDRMDITGDEEITQTDLDSLNNYFAKTEGIGIPDFYWSKRDSTQKEAWLEKIMDISKIENTCQENGIPGEICDCDQYATQQFFDFHGIDDPEIIDLFFEYYPHNYNLEDMNRFNIPNYRVITADFDSNKKFLGGHTQGVVTVGNNFLNFSDLNFLDEQFNAKDIQPGEWGFALGDSSEIRMRGPPKGPGSNTLVDYSTWDIVKGVPNLITHNTYNVNLITEKPKENLGITTDIDSEINYEVSPSINIGISDSNLKEAYITDGLTKKLLSNGNNQVNFDFSEGENTVWTYVKDIFDRDNVLKQKITVKDDINPRVNIASPVENEIYSTSPDFNFSVSDPNINSDSIYYTIDSETKNYFDGELSEITNLGYGDHALKVVGVDKAGNKTEKTIPFSIKDEQAPIIDWNYNASGTHSNNIAFDWNISDPNFQEAWFSKNGKKQNISQTGTIEFNNLPNGTYKFGIGALDTFGNADSTFEERTITGVGLENKLFGENFKVFPNPSINGLFTTKFKLENNQKVHGEIFDTSGRLIYNNSLASFAGENNMLIDLTNQPSGLYILQMRTTDGEVLGRKIIKNYF